MHIGPFNIKKEVFRYFKYTCCIKLKIKKVVFISSHFTFFNAFQHSLEEFTLNIGYWDTIFSMGSKKKVKIHT